MSCDTCRLVARRDAGEAPPWDQIVRTPLYDVVHAYNTSLPGWLVIVLRRHAAALDELTEDEAAALGHLVRATSVALKTVTGCAKTYIMQFAEADGHNHVHVHVVPRHALLPAEARGANIFRYLGITDDTRLEDDAMNEVAGQLQVVLDDLLEG